MHPPHLLVEESCPDVFIAGGGPAGLACAIAAAQRGLTVELADGMIPPIDKACGEGLMPDTITALAQLGIDDLSSVPAAPFQGIRFLANLDSADPIATQADFPEHHGRGMRRTILHKVLLDRAADLGVRFSWQTVVRSVEFNPNIESARPVVHTNRHSIRPGFIIGADGHRSRIRAFASLDQGRTTARRIGLCQHFNIERCNLPISHVNVYWAQNAQAYVTPVTEREICIAFVSRRKFSSVTDALSNFPQLRTALDHAIPTGPARGSITQNRKLDRVTRDNIALIGDASGSVDAVTGEGLGICFRQALALGEALQAGDLRLYQQAHSRLRRLPAAMAQVLLLLDAHPKLRNRSLRLLERHPDLFQLLLGIHIGQPAMHPGVLSAGFRLLTG
jgi:2-polyprenyl-6-methoxyphenol hydroxylase-like FAD-dependent oxidoreductase